ncbi:thiol:disulfide interchange protein TlpA [Microvirga pudoricolor]|uniref:thiol:disulfide interchange protein TlpA n=1 Tax=Microvirga pudoricolor TaxID=2778729 RepID=UPI00194FC99A|nr:TlpA family protein disulfide reductase [Microvirga pudoricolor]MBM6595491.1 TlpA family protein disulfide reductase [Microvirga pudoricolor]
MSDLQQTPSPSPIAPRPPRRGAASWLAGLAGLAVVGGGAWYGLSQHSSAAGAAECRASAAATERMKPLAKGEMAAVAVNAPRLPPEVSFLDPEGKPVTLADLKGKAVLVNLWATWCVPCRQEMPALDKLQTELGGSDFAVVAVNVDTRNAEKPKAWLQENGIRNLAYYSDPTGKILQVLQKSGHVVGLPTTLLVDASGCEVALLKGPAEWASPDAVAFMRAALGRS